VSKIELPPLPDFIATNLCAAMQAWCEAAEGDEAGEAFEQVVRRFGNELRCYARAAILDNRARQAPAPVEPKPDFCPHAHPFVYCETCVANPCPLGFGLKK